MTGPLAYYAAHGCALFPIPAGSKNPTGIVASFARDCTTNAAQWGRWSGENPGCNWGVVAGPSRLLIVDIDVSEIGRDRAWQIWADWCAAAGLAPIAPHVQSARGGWHVYFRMPDGSEPGDFQQSALVGRDAAGTRKPVIDMRVGNGFTVAAGSHYDGTAKGEESGTYVAMNDAPPYAAPQALLDACRRNVRTSSGPRPGDRDRDDVAALITWLTERDEFADYETWLSLGMALKLEFGDDGLELWRLSHDDTVTAEIETAKWRSFGDDPTAESVTLSSFLDRANRLGWRGQVRRSVAAMFGEAGQVAAIAAAAGALPMMGGQIAVADLGRPILDTFLAAQSANVAAGRASPVDVPTLPEACSGHPLFEPLNAAVAHIVGHAARAPTSLRTTAVADALAVLSATHEDTYKAVCARVRASGAALSESRLSSAARRFEAQVMRELRTSAGWATDRHGFPDATNTDNVAVFMRTIGADLRFNAWSQRIEIRWAEIDAYVPLQEKDFNNLLTTAGNGQFNFRPREAMFKRALSSLAHETAFDPVLAKLVEFESGWDGTPRLDTWLVESCGLPNDPYHQAVGRNLIGGIVKRARRPGCKHDEVVILIGPEDTFKSTMCRILAMEDAWFTDSIAFEGSPQNIIPQLFGKLVVELAELDGMARREVQYIKRFLSTQTDSVTLKYEAFSSDHARRCIFIGTSNESTPLRDANGNRRFLPVHIRQRIDIDWLRTNLAQIIGEAARLEAAGDLFLIPSAVIPEARARQDESRAESDFEIYLTDWFGRDDSPAFILSSDLATLVRSAVGRSVPANQYGTAMRRLGFFQGTRRVDGKSARVWCRGNSDQAQQYTSLRRPIDGRPVLQLPPLPQPEGGAAVLPMIRPQ